MRNEIDKLDNIKVKAFAYISVKENTSRIIKREKTLINRYSNLNEIEISKFYIDLYCSRMDLNHRKNLKKMIEDAKNRNIKVILIPQMATISRNAVLANNVIDEILKCNVDIIVCDTNICITQ